MTRPFEKEFKNKDWGLKMVKKYSKKIRPKIEVFELYQTTFYSTPYETFTGKSSKIKLVKLSDLKKEIEKFEKEKMFFDTLGKFEDETKRLRIIDIQHWKNLKQNLGIE